MEKYIRKCPKCGKDIEHKTKQSRDQSDKWRRLCRPCGVIYKDYSYMKTPEYRAKMAESVRGEKNGFYGKKHTEATKEKMSKNSNRGFMQTAEYKQKVSANTKGKKNPMYGISFYEVWLKKYGREKADILMEKLKKQRRKQCAGVGNPMYGKPTPQGSGNGWSGWYNGIFFRSLKELTYMVDIDKRCIKWTTAENIKIKYVNWDGTERTYCPDFLVDDKYLVEIKPTRLQSSRIVKLKQKAAEIYCASQRLVYDIIDPIVLSDHEIKMLHKSGTVKFTDRYEKLFMERYSCA